MAAERPVTLAKYILPHHPDSAIVHIVGYEDLESGEYEWYDLFTTPEGESDCIEICLNEGEPICEWPTYEEVLDFWQQHLDSD